MADDRELRDELEKVQSEVLRRKRALEQPEGLHTDVRARVESLRRSRAQQQARLDEALAELDVLDGEVHREMEQNAKLQAELDRLSVEERTLVAATVYSLDPGPRRSAGCLSALAVLAAALALGGVLVSLEQAIAAARAELQRLEQAEADALGQSGLRTLVEQLTAENQQLTERRRETRERIDDLRKAISAAKQNGAELELQLKGARSRVAKLKAAVSGGRS